jgi:hypothetical protein
MDKVQKHNSFENKMFRFHNLPTFLLIYMLKKLQRHCQKLKCCSNSPLSLQQFMKICGHRAKIYKERKAPYSKQTTLLRVARHTQSHVIGDASTLENQLCFVLNILTEF